MRAAICVTICVLLSSSPAAAKPSEDPGRGKKAKKAVTTERVEKRYFPVLDVRVIQEYYAPRYRTLPPGLQKKLVRTGHLPPGWERKLEPFPVVVERQLIPLPSPYRRGVLDGYAVVYDPRTQVIVDVTAIFRP